MGDLALQDVDKGDMMCRQVWQSPGGSPWTPQSPARSLKSPLHAQKTPQGLSPAQLQPESVWAGKDAGNLKQAILSKVLTSSAKISLEPILVLLPSTQCMYAMTTHDSGCSFMHVAACSAGSSPQKRTRDTRCWISTKERCLQAAGKDGRHRVTSLDGTPGEHSISHGLGCPYADPRSPEQVMHTVLWQVLAFAAS